MAAVTNVLGTSINAEMLKRERSGNSPLYQYHTAATAGGEVFKAGALEVAITPDGAGTTVTVNGQTYQGGFAQTADENVLGTLPQYTVGAGALVVIVYNEISV